MKALATILITLLFLVGTANATGNLSAIPSTLDFTGSVTGSPSPSQSYKLFNNDPDNAMSVKITPMSYEQLSNDNVNFIGPLFGQLIVTIPKKDSVTIYVRVVTSIPIILNEPITNYVDAGNWCWVQIIGSVVTPQPNKKVVWTIKNGALDGVGNYIFEVWARATEDSVLVLGTNPDGHYGTMNCVTPKWNPSALLMIDRNGLWGFVYYADPRWEASYNCGWSTRTDIPDQTVIYFYLKNGATPNYLSQDAPDGEKIFWVKLKVTNPSLDPELGWKPDNPASPNFGILGDAVTNTFTVGINSPLPIQLSSFSAPTIASTGVTLVWETISETNNLGFYVQRDGVNIPGAFVPGHGTTLQRQTYRYADKSPLVGQHNYRLKQVDLDGTSMLSEAVVVNVPAAFVLSQNYPNPFNPATMIKFSLSQCGPVNLSVYNMIGECVVTLVEGVLVEGEHAAVWDASKLSSGMYVYVLRAEGRVETRKMILIK